MGITLEAYYSDAPKSVKFFVFANKFQALGNATRYSPNMAKQGMESTCSMHRGNVPQTSRGTQVDAPWHSCECSTEMFHRAGNTLAPS
jgi:hypothetical protein